MEHGLYGEVERDITASRQLNTATVPLPPHQTRASVSPYVSSAAVRVYLVRRGVGQPQYTAAAFLQKLRGKCINY